MQKKKTYRSKRYMDFVKGRSCAVYEFWGDNPIFGGTQCGGEIIPHHTETGGVGMKGSDLSCVPLCSDHHNVLHQCGLVNFKTIYSLDAVGGMEREVIKANQAYIQHLESKK